jgi:hypothetical protein
MTKGILALVTAGALGVAAVAAPAPAEARNRGGAIAAGVIGGLALGAIASGAYAGNRYYGGGPYYAAPARVYYGPDCHWQRQRVWDGYGWRVQRVRVCY